MSTGALGREGGTAGAIGCCTASQPRNSAHISSSTPVTGTPGRSQPWWRRACQSSHTPTPRSPAGAARADAATAGRDRGGAVHSRSVAGPSPRPPRGTRSQLGGTEYSADSHAWSSHRLGPAPSRVPARLHQESPSSPAHDRVSPSSWPPPGRPARAGRSGGSRWPRLRSSAASGAPAASAPQRCSRRSPTRTGPARSTDTSSPPGLCSSRDTRSDPVTVLGPLI